MFPQHSPIRSLLNYMLYCITLLPISTKIDITLAQSLLEEQTP